MAFGRHWLRLPGHSGIYQYCTALDSAVRLLGRDCRSMTRWDRAVLPGAAKPHGAADDSRKSKTISNQKHCILNSS
jgi:hypothetical protein